MSNYKIAYLDYNVIVSIDEGKLLLSDILKAIPSISNFVYSSAHIEETLNISKDYSDSRIKQRLATINSITNSPYIYQDLSNLDIYLMKISAFDMAEQLRDGVTRNLRYSVLNLVPKEAKELFRKIMNVDIKDLNNVKPKDVVNHLNERIGLHGINSFTEMSDKSISSNPQMV